MAYRGASRFWNHKEPMITIGTGIIASHATSGEMMKNAADEMGPSHIRFNSIRPGFIATEIMEGVPRESDVYGSYIENTPMEGVGES